MITAIVLTLMGLYCSIIGFKSKFENKNDDMALKMVMFISAITFFIIALYIFDKHFGTGV